MGPLYLTQAEVCGDLLNFTSAAPPQNTQMKTSASPQNTHAPIIRRYYIGQLGEPACFWGAGQSSMGQSPKPCKVQSVGYAGFRKLDVLCIFGSAHSTDYTILHLGLGFCCLAPPSPASQMKLCFLQRHAVVKAGFLPHM